MWDWLNGISDWASQLGADIIAFLEWLLQELIAVFQYLYTLLAGVFQFFLQLMKTIGAFFKTIWEFVYQNIITPIWHALVKIHDWLEARLSPIISFLTKVKAYLLRWFNAYIKPILKMISAIRKFLEILKAFGVKWAASLDKILGQIQADITKTFLKVQGYLNNLINIVNALADPLGLFRRPTLLMSMRRIFPGFMRGFTGMPLGYFFPSPRQGASAGTGPTQFPLNLSNSAQNPPPSSYFSGNDGLGSFGGFDMTSTPSDDAGDGMSALDYFDDSAWASSPVTDPASAISNQQSAIIAQIAGTA